MSKTGRNDDEDKTMYNTVDVSMAIIVCCIYLIGVFFLIKIIKVSKREKETCWTLNIFDSCCKMLHYGLVILMNGINYAIPDLHNYTGQWLCYTYKAFWMYGSFSVFGHSFVVSVMKHVIIVYSLKVRAFGQEKIQTIFFWINAFYPIYINAVFTIVRPDFFIIYDGVFVANRCLGLSDLVSSQDGNRSATKLHNICEITEPISKNSIEYFGYVCRTGICWFNVIFVYSNAWNIIECLVYIQTFRFMNK